MIFEVSLFESGLVKCALSLLRGSGYDFGGKLLGSVCRVLVDFLVALCEIPEGEVRWRQHGCSPISFNAGESLVG